MYYLHSLLGLANGPASVDPPIYGWSLSVLLLV